MGFNFHLLIKNSENIIMKYHNEIWLIICPQKKKK